MNLIIIYATATTGLLETSEPAIGPSQPDEAQCEVPAQAVADNVGGVLQSVRVSTDVLVPGQTGGVGRATETKEHRENEF